MLRRNSSLIWLAAAFAVGTMTDVSITDALAQSSPLTGSAAFGDWRSDKPGTCRLIKPEDLPKPGATPSAANSSRVVGRPASAVLQVPAGFKIELFADGLSGPRQMRVAPNGDVFIAETRSGRIRILRAADGATRPSANEIYANGLNGPFGIAFYPAGNDPKWIYVANDGSVVRFPYKTGDLRASSKPEIIVAQLPHDGGHSTRDIAFSLDGKRMMISVGSRSNDAEGMNKAPAGWIDSHPLGASWDSETDRADVLTFDPDGKRLGVFATGIRNCVGLAVHPTTGDLYCSTNERDGLGDNLVPDYVTRVREGAFYGWPWFYIGNNQDPKHRGERTDLKGKITIPDVLLQAHSASLGLTFYDGNQFPAGIFRRRLCRGARLVEQVETYRLQGHSYSHEGRCPHRRIPGLCHGLRGRRFQRLGTAGRCCGRP